MTAPAYAYEPLKQEDAPAQPAPSSARRRLGAFAALFLGTIAFSAIVFRPAAQIEDLIFHDAAAEDAPTLAQCAAPVVSAAKPPAPINPWASLTVDETSDVQRWLEAPERGLNLTRAQGSVMSDNVIFLIERHYPAKVDALAYLDNPVPELEPAKYARVSIHEGTIPAVKVYLVGPLPTSEETTMRELTEIYHRDIPFNARSYITGDELPQMLGKVIPPLADAMQELFNGSARGLPNDTFVASGSAPFSYDGEFRRMWISWRRNAPGPWLHPIGFWQYVDMSGTDPEEWKILKVVYNKQVFDSVDDFNAALKDGTLVRSHHDSNADVSWATRKPSGPVRDLEHLPGPRSVSFAGLRFRIDRKTQFVSWMGWSMYLGFDRDMGLNFWDIRIKGERIIYELSPQEAIAQYSGNDPLQASTAWLDRHFGMGKSVRDMLPGYDCPHEAVFLPATTHSGLGSVRVERAICIFEQDSGKPITRHTGYLAGEFGAVKGYTLTIRSISTVGNYDYLFDYLFHLDGTMEVKLSASGYLQGGFWEPSQNGYGGRIRDSSMGNLHDHIINYKVDFDIAGVKNTPVNTTISQEVVHQPWFSDDWGADVTQGLITKTFIKNEDEALLKWPANFQGGFSVVNQAEKNRWDMPRGYAVHPGMSPIHNTVVGSRRMLKNANWARYNMAFSRRKESEPSSSNAWNMNLPGAPVVDFHDFFDGESLEQEDVVAWINVGMHHLPQAEDSPNTKTNIATTGFILTPLNFFDSDISMEMSNAIVLTAPLNPGDPFTFDNYGVDLGLTCVPAAPAPFEYTPFKSFDVEGKQMPYGSMEDVRKDAEGYHRIRIEL
ncbi:copper amine oxidase [Schizophyllum amplum]|uniref:Amine oxidase n=1 Tax=Schizophyllum amplum TaxID=97359 RepID=A0A550CRP1_9AGAR|nr:copper amine oxidase [Auriculariopsis ampla]